MNWIIFIITLLQLLVLWHYRNRDEFDWSDWRWAKRDWAHEREKRRREREDDPYAAPARPPEDSDAPDLDWLLYWPSHY